MFQPKPTPGTPLDPLHPLSRGLIGCWLGGEVAGSKLGDSSPFNRPATLTGGVSWTGGHHGGRAVQFDGTTGYIALPDLSAVTVTRATFVLWVRVNAHTPAGSPGGWYLNTSSGGGSHYPWSDGSIYEGTFAAARKTVGAGLVTDRSRWHQVAITTEAGAGWRFYQNTQLVFSASADSSITLVSGPQIGKNSGGYMMPAAVDAIRLYADRALSASEIAQLYANPWAGFRARRNWYIISAPAGGNTISGAIVDAGDAPAIASAVHVLGSATLAESLDAVSVAAAVKASASSNSNEAADGSSGQSRVLIGGAMGVLDATDQLAAFGGPGQAADIDPHHLVFARPVSRRVRPVARLRSVRAFPRTRHLIAV